MERIDLVSEIDVLRAANQRFSEFFARFCGAPVQGSDEEVDALLQLERTLRSVGALLKAGMQNSRSAEMQDELTRYRENLLRLRHELGVMQDSADACRARLFMRQQHLDAAQQWCATARATR